MAGTEDRVHDSMPTTLRIVILPAQTSGGSLLVLSRFRSFPLVFGLVWFGLFFYQLRVYDRLGK